MEDITIYSSVTTAWEISQDLVKLACILGTWEGNGKMSKILENLAVSGIFSRNCKKVVYILAFCQKCSTLIALFIKAWHFLIKKAEKQ